MGHEIIYPTYGMSGQLRQQPLWQVSRPAPKYSSLQECEKGAADLGLDGPADENERHYHWIRDKQGNIVARSDNWWECRAIPK
jgi:hypothetical protein